MVQEDFSEQNALVKEQMRLFAERLRFERQKRQISQMDLAFKAGLAQNSINWIETGKIAPTISTVFKISNALEISPAVLFNISNEEQAKARETVIELVSRYM